MTDILMFNLKLQEMKNDEKDELVSLNDKLYDEFYVQELVETDPLIVGGLLDLFTDSTDSANELSRSVGETPCALINVCGVDIEK